MIHYYTQKRELPPSEIYEDMKTSAVFEILSLLPPEKIWDILREASELPTDIQSPQSLKDVWFWPHLEGIEGTDHSRFVEPDVIFQFDNVDVIIEAKRNDNNPQNPKQWDSELEAYKERKITQNSFTQSLALLAICLLVGVYVADFIKGLELGFTLPTFVYCLFTGVILRNSLSALKIHEVFDREVGLLGNVSLALFLAFALMSIDLVQLANLALPIFSVLFVQSVLMVFFAIFVTFRFCGKDYDAAVLSAGHCGFGMGATPTAMVNMQAVCKNYGMSHTAFIIVPLCGAFFIDIVNSFVIKGFLYLF